MFSVLLYLLLQDHITKLDTVIIDTEYTGYEAVIKNRVLTLCRRQGMKVFADQITFQQVEKKSLAHIAAIAVLEAKYSQIAVSAQRKCSQKCDHKKNRDLLVK